jgi:hypothetical protein
MSRGRPLTRSDDLGRRWIDGRIEQTVGMSVATKEIHEADHVARRHSSDHQRASCLELDAGTAEVLLDLHFDRGDLPAVPVQGGRLLRRVRIEPHLDQEDGRRGSQERAAEMRSAKIWAKRAARRSNGCEEGRAILLPYAKAGYRAT